ncbi:arachidonate lipoxygenase epidermal [Cricetulus griseus]
MGKYMIRVVTGDSLLAGSSNLVQLWLVGEHGEADLGKQFRPLRRGTTELEIDVPVHLGRLLLVKMHKHRGLLDSDWFCKWVTVQGPGTQGEAFFPCYSWVQNNETICLSEGTALKVNDDTQSLFKKYREQEMEDRRKVYRLKEFAIKGTLDFISCVQKLEDYQKIFPHGATALAGRVRDSWKDDALFGYQFLNGANPMLLRRSKSLPARLVLPPEMQDLQTQLEKELQAGSLFEADFSLLDGVKPNIIIFKQQYVTAPLVMLKMEPDGRLLPMLIQLQPPRHGCSPPLLFLPSDPPMAWLLAKIWVRSSDFQLHQLQSHLLRGHLMAEVISVATMRSLPSLHPVYKLDWYAWIPNGPCTMRKPPPTSKDVTEKDILDAMPTLQQARMQMTFTKFLGRRQPAMVALGQHNEEYFSGPEPRAVLKQFQEELAIMDKEIEVRNASLDLPYEYLRPSVVENSVVSTGSGGHVDILQRATACLTYRSFCPPDDLADRGLLDVKSSLYAQDALRLWEIIHRYVERMLEIFYKSDSDVKDDPELQVWCREITEIGLLGGQDRGAVSLSDFYDRTANVPYPKTSTINHS